MKKDVKFILIGLILFFGILFIRECNKYKDINNNKNITTGKIIEFRSNYQARYTLVYEYYVKNKRYLGYTGVSSFYCDNGKKACVGSEFNVYYSDKNPENSRIDLGKYEKYKTTVEFIK